MPAGSSSSLIGEYLDERHYHDGEQDCHHQRAEHRGSNPVQVEAHLRTPEYSPVTKAQGVFLFISEQEGVFVQLKARNPYIACER